MKEHTQIAWVRSQLKEHGQISRNACLQNHISRLSALIQDLEREGFVFAADYFKTEYGKDYIYKVVGRPQRHVLHSEIVEDANGRHLKQTWVLEDVV